jgi:LysR family transcriptional regulator, hydrogen peroxide-inducible genes activator
MNIQQLEYIVAVDLHRHFGKAAEACHVTQPTLSMMIRKLEEELDIRIFDRTRKPVVPTETGALIIEQARAVLRETRRIQEIVDQRRAVPEGTLHVGIIPTLAPYLVPLFIKSFLVQYPRVQLRIAEHTTDLLLEHLRKGRLDVGILVTPLEMPSFLETPLFYEAFLVYSSHTYPGDSILPEQIDPDALWLLEEGHCFRSQILNLCDLRRRSDLNLAYAAGSIETLIRLVDSQQGITVLPELAALGMTRERRRRLIRFADPVPVREVSLVTDRDQAKKHLIDLLQQEILHNLPLEIRQKSGYARVPIVAP